MTKHLTFALPETVAAHAATAAEAAGESLDAFAARALDSQAERDRTRRFFDERRTRADIPRALAFLHREGGEPPRAGDEPPDD